MNTDLKPFFTQLPNALHAERHRLHKRLQGLERRLQQGVADEAELLAVAEQLQASIERRAQRAANLPRPRFPEQLPVSARHADIEQALRDNQVIVVAGETGSGKTTQLPKICLAAGRGIDGFIGCTQPRRIAARTIADRIAAELGSEVGRAVGFKVRFHDRVGADTYIKLMTDGILLAELQSDRFLDAYDTIIIDEAHERNLNTDFLLGYLKQLLPKRRDLKLIITSATIDTARFAEFFDAPVIDVEGRMYPVEVRYRAVETLTPTPLPAGEGLSHPSPAGRGVGGESSEIELPRAVAAAVDEVWRGTDGDILVFLPGERDIRETAEVLRKHHPPQTEILPLYARLSAVEQNKVFQPGDKRRIVLATNVAETSLTVPRIRAVIDPGLARLNRYSVRVKVQRLAVEKISRASADQRKGRCGRIGPGLCIRLYSEDDFLGRAEFTPPEILRTSLAAVVLRMLDLHLGEPDKFPLLERPERKRFNEGFKQLEELGAIDRKRRLTPLGKHLAKWPVDPRLARMVLAAKDEGCLGEVLVLAAALSIQDPRERPLEAQQAADQAHAEFRDERSDFISFLNLWTAFHEQQRHLSHNKLRQWCRAHFLSFNRMREWHDLHQQLFTLAREQGWQPNQEPAEYAQVHRALLSGLLSHIAVKETPAVRNAGKEEEGKRRPKPRDSGAYLGARNSKLYIFPGSGLFKKKPKWIMGAELAETSKLYARCVAEFDPLWAEQLAGDLCKRSYSEPHWEKRAGQVAAFEQVSLYGLILVPRRKVDFGSRDPRLAREIFIREALVEGHFHTHAEFFRHNRTLVEEIETLEHKTRRPDILVEPETVYQFYVERIPEGIYSAAAFEQWRKQAERDNPRLLFLARDDLMQRESGPGTGAFPDHLSLHGMELDLKYHFAPGDDADGVTLCVPLAVLGQVPAGRCEWLVPGLLQEKITALIRGLPKNLRKNFVPAPNFAEAACAALEPSATPLGEALGVYLERIAGVPVPLESWEPAKLPAHLHMRFEVLDEDGRVIDQGRDLTALLIRWEQHGRDHFAQLPKAKWEREGVTAWDFGDLAEQIELHTSPSPPAPLPRGEGRLTFLAYPALQDEDGSVALRLFDAPDKAEQAHRGGVRRLIELTVAGEIRRLRRHVRFNQTVCKEYMPFGSCEQLKQDLIDALIDELFLSAPLPRTQADFQQRVEAGLKKIFRRASEQAEHLRLVFAEYAALPRDVLQSSGARATDLSQLKAMLNPRQGETYEAIREHLDTLIYSGFMRRTPPAQLQHLPRYLQAVRLRLERLARDPAKDAQKYARLAPFWHRYAQRRGARETPELDAFRWLLEEFRVSLFAQELKTAVGVSPQRLEKAWETVVA